MRLVGLIFFFLLPVVAFAQGKTTCVCQIGLEPSYQQVFFEKGCRKWLEEQKDCDSKEIRPQFQGNDQLVLNEDSSDGTLKLGYVGHWGNTVQSYNYFVRYLAPAMNKYRLGLYWDNTACRGLDDPKKFMSLLEISRNNENVMRESDIRSNELQKSIARIYGREAKLKPVRELPFWMTAPFTYKANQVISIGMWDRYVGGSSANFWAVVNVANNKITLPKCEQFHDKMCYQGNQLGESGRCVQPDGQIKNLVCCLEQNFYDGGSQRAFWVEGKTCGQ